MSILSDADPVRTRQIQAEQPPTPLAALLAEVLTPALFRRWLERQDSDTPRVSLCGLLDGYLCPHIPGYMVRLIWLPWSAHHYLALADERLPLDDWLDTYLIVAVDQLTGEMTSTQALAWLDSAVDSCRSPDET